LLWWRASNRVPAARIGRLAVHAPSARSGTPRPSVRASVTTSIGVGVGVGVAVGVWVGVAVAVRAVVDVAVGFGVGLGVGVAVSVGFGVEVGPSSSLRILDPHLEPVEHELEPVDEVLAFGDLRGLIGLGVDVR